MSSPVKIVPFEEKFLEETLQFLRDNNPDHPELGDRQLFSWQRCTRYLALFGNKVVSHIAHMKHKFQYGSESIDIGWGITLVLDMSNFVVKTFAGTACWIVSLMIPLCHMPPWESFRKSSRLTSEEVYPLNEMA